MKNYLILLAVFFISCQLIPENLNPTQKNEEVILSQFEKAGYNDLLIAKDGTYHAVFLEQQDFGKPVFVYYCSSSNNGKSWSKPVNISNDNTGNGASYPKLIQDNGGTIYAIWKRYGSSDPKNYPVSEVLLEGTGGYSIGTLFYATLSGTTFSKPIMLADNEQKQVSWFTALDKAGKVRVVWSEISEESKKHNWNSWYFADIITEATLNGGSFGDFLDYTSGSKPDYPGGAPPKLGYQNLRGYYDNQNKLRMIGEFLNNDIKSIFYFNGNKSEIIYQYPLYKEGNTFNNPAELLVDEANTDHIVFKPSPATLESEQIWDFNTSSRKTSVIASIQKSGVKIQGFQAYQGPNGQMATIVQAGGLVESNEAFGLFYQNGKWISKGLTQNASKDTFVYAEYVRFDGYLGSISSTKLTFTNYVDVAWDASGKKSMLMTSSAYFIGQGFSTSNPSVYFSKID